MKKYLVLGGSGFIGQHLVQQLAKKNKVIVGDIKKNINFVDNSNILFQYNNFIETEDFADYLDNIDVVFHLISTIMPHDGTQNINSEIKENIFPTINLLDSMIKKEVKNIVYISSGGTIYGEKNNQIIKETEYKEPISKYAILKLMIEKYLHLYNRHHNLNYKVIRLSNPYGILKNKNRKQGAIPIFINKLMNNEPITIWGDGTNIRDYIYIDDVIDGILSILSYRGEEKKFNLGYGKGYSLNYIIELITRELQINNPKINYISKRLCDVKENILDVSLIKKCTGWYPKINIKEGIRFLISEMK